MPKLLKIKEVQSLPCQASDECHWCGHSQVQIKTLPADWCGKVNSSSEEFLKERINFQMFIFIDDMCILFNSWICETKKSF